MHCIYLNLLIEQLSFRFYLIGHIGSPMLVCNNLCVEELMRYTILILLSGTSQPSLQGL